MAKKIRRVRTFARTASKSMEKKLIENAKNLADSPTLILPEYSDSYSEKIFRKFEKKLSVISKYKDNTKKLEKLSNRKDLAGALAGTMLVAISEKAPYLAVAKFPTGDITYAQRGRADKEKLIAIQHYDDPILRLLAIKDIALKKNLHIYSWDEGYYSSGKIANPPKDFIDFINKKINFKSSKNVLTCGNLNPELIKDSKNSKKNYLRIHWKSADLYFGICEDCAKKTKNTIFNITKYILQPDISEDFCIKVIGQVVKKKDSNQQTQYIDEYLSGKLTDLDFIKKNMKDRESSIKDSEEKIYVLDGTSYGDDINSFIDALKPDKYEKQGLKIILEQVEGPVVLNSVTPNKVLEIYWKEHGLTSIQEIIEDEEMAKKFFALDDTPSDILELVFGYKERQKILSELPKYKSLPALSAFVDNIARTYRTFGEKKALSEIKKRPNNPKGKSLAYAFLLAFGKGSDKKWQFSQVEIEYGEFLKEYVKKLLDAKPKNYHQAFKDLIVASGSSENIDDFIV